MKKTRFIASILFYLFRVLSALYILSAVHIAISSGFKPSTIEIRENGQFAIKYPFTNTDFLLGSEFSLPYISEMVFTITFYGIFFFSLSNVFYTFKQLKLFTPQAVKNLKYFYLFNLIIAPIALGVLSIIASEDLPYIGMIVAHFIFGIFSLFIESIFSQGLNLQNEQDLFI